MLAVNLADILANMVGKQFGASIHPAGIATLDGPWQMPAWSWGNRSTRTGGPDDEDDEAAIVRKLMPIVAILIMLAIVFG